MAEDYLAQYLEAAAADPACKPEFAKALLASTVFVLGEIESEDPAQRSKPSPAGGGNVVLRSQLTPEGRAIVPCFSSLEKLQGFIQGPDKVSYLSLPARTLLEIAKGATVVLNPGSPVTSEISPEDGARLLAQAVGAP